MTGSETLRKLSSQSLYRLASIKGFLIPFWKALQYDFSDFLLPQRALSVSFEQNNLSITCVTKIFSRYKVLWSKSYPFDFSTADSESFASTVALAIKEHNLRVSSVSLNIPKALAITKILEFPSSVKEDLQNVISYEMDRLTPFEVEDVFYDFKIIEETSEKIKVLLAVTKIQLLKPYIDALATKGIKVQKITLNLSAVGSLINYAYKPLSSLYIEIDETGYEGVLFLQTKPVNIFAHKFRYEDDKNRSIELSENIKKIISFTNKDDLKLPIYVYFKEKNRNFKENFKVILNMPVIFFDEIDDKIGFSSKSGAISYSSIGCAIDALWHQTDAINLLSRGKTVKQKKPILLTIILLIILLSIVIINFSAPLYFESKKIEEVDRQLSLKKDEVKKVEALKKDIEALNKDIATINEFKNNRQMTLVIIKEFTSIIPKNAWLTRLRITEKVVEIEGYASSATELLPKLEASKFFQKVEFASPTFRDVRMNADRFSIKMEIEGAIESEAKEE